MKTLSKEQVYMWLLSPNEMGAPNVSLFAYKLKKLFGSVPPLIPVSILRKG